MMLSLYYRDKETGKAYASHRDAFDSATGRFNQFDPLGVRVGVNGYLYVSAAPLRYEDPEGLFSLNAFFQGGAGAGFQVLFAGLNFNCGAAISTGLQRCAYCTVCVRLGPGLFIGGGGVAGGGVVNGNTQNLAGYSFGAGFDLGLGESVGGSVAVGLSGNPFQGPLGVPTSVGALIGRYGGGVGVGAGIELCKTKLTCQGGCENKQ